MRLLKKAPTRPQAHITTRIVCEKRWMPASQITMGMYVEELDKPWSETSFMFQGFRIDSPDVLQAVRESCEQALVRTEKLANISSNSTYRLVGSTRKH